MPSSPCKEPDPNKFDTHLERIKDPAKRNQGFSGLEKLTKTVVTARENDDLLDEFVEKVIPAFEEVWDEAEEHQSKMLTMLRDVGRPEAADLWDRALELDGSDAKRQMTILALDGIKKAKATDSTEAIVEELKKVLKDHKLDSADKEEGRLRKQMCNTLGTLGDKRAVPALIEVMKQTKETQPVVVHRAAAEALGRIGDPSATDALLTVTFRVPDAPTTTNIGEKAKIALVGIGEPAVPRVMAMLRGEHSEVQELAAKNGVQQLFVQQTATSILGAMGAKSAVDELISYMPQDACLSEEEKKAAEKTKKKEEGGPELDEATKGGLRGVIANALGLIGDEKAVAPLCKCVMATGNPGDMFPIMEALGRIGGSEAAKCLSTVIKSGEYTAEGTDKDMKYEPRWLAGRFATLAATPGDVATVKEAIASNTDAKVKENMAPWDAGIKILETCGEDKGCYLKTLGDINGDWFAREKAAFEVAKASPGDVKAAEAVAAAFKVRNPDARVSMAWLPTRMLEKKKCPACVESYRAVMDAEKMSMDKLYQLSVLVARASIAKLQDSAQADAGEKEAE